MAIALIATGSFVPHLHEALPGGRLLAGGQRAFWLPWQLYANVVSGRGLDDSSGFLGAPDAGLFALVGNPGAAAFLAPLHALGSPILAHNLGLFLLVLTNALGAWAFGETLRPRPRGLLAAAMVGGAGWWMAQLGQGALAAAWVGPGLLAAAALRRGRVDWFIGAFLVGLVGAPIVTAAALVASRLVPAPPTTGQPPYALGGAALALLVGVAAPAAVAGGATQLPPNILFWLASGEAPGFPLVFVLGIGALWAARPARIPARSAALLALVAVLVGVGPFARDATGALLRLDGFSLPIGPNVAFVTTHGQELLSAALLVGMVGALGWAGRARLGRLAELAAVAALLVEPRLQSAFGQPVALWDGHAWPVPRAFRDMARTPYKSAIVQLPLLDLADGLVGFVPFHRQTISGGPGLDADGAARLGVKRAASQDPALQTTLHLGDGVAASLDLGVLLKKSGYDWLLVAGPQPALRVATARALGKPAYEDGAFAIWATGLGPSPGATAGRPGEPPGAVGAPVGAPMGTPPGTLPGAPPGTLPGAPPGEGGGAIP